MRQTTQILRIPSEVNIRIKKRGQKVIVVSDKSWDWWILKESNSVVLRQEPLTDIQNRWDSEKEKTNTTHI